jgi:hypothetical protein
MPASVPLRALVLLCLLTSWAVAGPCAHLKDCSGHGDCDPVALTCNCYNGWGAADDIATYKSPDCSLRTSTTGSSPRVEGGCIIPSADMLFYTLRVHERALKAAFAPPFRNAI